LPALPAAVVVVVPARCYGTLLLGTVEVAEHSTLLREMPLCVGEKPVWLVTPEADYAEGLARQSRVALASRRLSRPRGPDGADVLQPKFLVALVMQRAQLQHVLAVHVLVQGDKPALYARRSRVAPRYLHAPGPEQFLRNLLHGCVAQRGPWWRGYGCRGV
tara:strand:- start:854 stop:1336 length:483 start_codon:yes stop_codon:yes gene_type:complete